MSSSTPPISDLCRMSGETIFITTGKPIFFAAITAASISTQTSSGAEAMPACASSCLACASEGFCAGRVIGASLGAGRPGGLAKARPNCPMASIATTAREGSSNTIKPSLSYSRICSREAMSDNTKIQSGCLLRAILSCSRRRGATLAAPPV